MEPVSPSTLTEPAATARAGDPVPERRSALAFDRGPAVGEVAVAATTSSTGCPTCWTTRWVPAAPRERPALTSPEAAAEVLVPALVGADRERCLTAVVDTKHRLLAVVTSSIGSLDRTFMAPREILRDALLHNAAALVLAHNHPSGDPEPSRDDEQVTRRLVRAGELVGVEVLDHLVVGGTRWVSLARRGIL